jgi:hypothetical protein
MGRDDGGVYKYILAFYTTLQQVHKDSYWSRNNYKSQPRTNISIGSLTYFRLRPLYL